MVVQNENTRGAKGLCLEVHDLLVAKIVAGREKDYDFLREAARHQMAEPVILLERLDRVEVPSEVRSAARGAIGRAFRSE